MAASGSVTITIMGRDYQISCPPEEEESLRVELRKQMASFLYQCHYFFEKVWKSRTSYRASYDERLH